MAKYKTVLTGLKKYRPVKEQSLDQTAELTITTIYKYAKKDLPVIRKVGFPDFYYYWMDLVYEGVMDIFEKENFEKLYDSYQLNKSIAECQIELLDLGEGVNNYIMLFYDLYFQIFFKESIDIDQSKITCSKLEKYLQSEDDYQKMYGELEEFEFFKMLIQFYENPKYIDLFLTKYDSTKEKLIESVELRFWERVNTDGDINSSNIMPILPLQIMALVSVMQMHGFETDTNTDLLKKYFPLPEQSFNVTDEHAIKFIEILKKIEIQVKNNELVKFEYNL